MNSFEGNWVLPNSSSLTTASRGTRQKAPHPSSGAQGKSIKSIYPNNTFAIGIVPTRLEPFLFNAFFQGLFLFEQIEGEMP